MSEADGTSIAAGTLIGGRYIIEATLGQGGMAVVYQALDTASNHRVALKRLRTDEEARDVEKSVGAFEREYLTLAQLTHPGIVQVHDYGVDHGVPHYTMELLDGGDLLDHSPVPWAKACTWGREIASALALLHSRREIYRDLSPRNVRCTHDGRAKLIDFGAMTVMGPNRELIGTLPYVAPEALQLQPLDARTDLYALGATLYFMLTKRNAYPARDIDQLRDLWRSRPRRPSELSPGVPPALDRLVLDLISLDPAVRPVSASEVMQRLSAIAGLGVSEQDLVTQAYLSTPALVGCAGQLATVRKLILRASNQRGVSLLIEGPPGIGCSRFLDACVLEAKLAGVSVLRSDATDAQAGDYGVVRALARQLLAVSEALARTCAEPYLPLLGHVVPELIAQRPEVVLENLDDVGQRQRRLLAPLSRWLLDVARQRPLMLAVDDAHRIDGNSAGLLALLAQELGSHGLVIAAAARSDEADPGQVQAALDLIRKASTVLELQPLSLALTENLLGSVFSNAPNLPQLAAHIDRVARGIPRDIMRLAQHLVSERVIQYQAGAWTLPDRLGAAQLPASMAEALQARIDKLSPRARELAIVFAFEPRRHFSFEACRQLADDAVLARVSLPSGHASGSMPFDSGRSETLQALDELVAAEVLSCVAGERYSLAQQGWAEALTSAASPTQAATAHLRLALLLEQTGSDDFRAASHLMEAGEELRGVDLLVRFARTSKQQTDADPNVFYEMVATLPHDWLHVYERGLALCDKLSRPRMDRDALLARIAGLGAHAVTVGDDYAHVDLRIAQLRKDAGLDDFAALPDTLDFGTRLRTALGTAQARYEATPESERAYDVKGALGQLAQAVVTALGLIGVTSDYAAWCRLPTLAPLVPVAPPLAIVDLLRLGVGARITGRGDETLRIYQEVLDRVSQPDRGGLAVTAALATTLRVNLSIATLEAALGRPSSLERAQLVERQPQYDAQAILVRHLYHLWRGELHEASRCKQQIEILRSQSNTHHGFEGQHLLSELCAHALVDDLTGVKSALDLVEPQASRYAAWRHVLHYGRGEVERIRGDYTAALAELALALVPMEVTKHQLWANAACAHMRVLLELGDHAEALARGETYLRVAKERDLGYLHNLIRMPLSIALVKSGQTEEAIAVSQQIIGELLAIETQGLMLAAAYETRAQIAFELQDEEGFQHFATLCAQQSGGSAKRLLGARYQRLSLASAEQADQGALITQFTITLDACESARERARIGLEYLAQHSGATAGLLLTNTDDGLTQSACIGDLTVDPALAAWAEAYFSRELADDENTSAFSVPPPADPDAPDTSSPPSLGPDLRYMPVLLTHQIDRGYVVTGLAVLVARTDAPFLYPSRFAAELSRSLTDAGDVVAGET